jgi:hypothetical protein
MTTMTSTAPAVTGGVDTHADMHVVAAVDQVGGVLGTASFPTPDLAGSRPTRAAGRPAGPGPMVKITSCRSTGGSGSTDDQLRFRV